MTAPDRMKQKLTKAELGLLRALEDLRAALVLAHGLDAVMGDPLGRMVEEVSGHCHRLNLLQMLLDEQRAAERERADGQPRPP